MAENTIAVQAGPKVEAGRVAIWDRDEAHPDGELFISKAHEGGADEVHEVAETPGVIQAIGDGRLVRAERARTAERRVAAPRSQPRTGPAGGDGQADGADGGEASKE